MFPIKLLDANPVRAVSTEDLEKKFHARERVAKKRSTEELLRRAHLAGRQASKRIVHTTFYERNADIAEYAKRKAEGICGLCNAPAPFTDLQGEPYLESHHIHWLSRGGPDTLENTIALCANCHRKMHVLDQASAVEFLKRKAIDLAQDV